MTVQAVWSLVRFHWVALVLATVLGAALGFNVAALTPTQYSAQAEVFVAANNTSASADVAQGVEYSQDQARNFAAVVSRQVVLQRVKSDLGLDLSLSDLRDMVSASVPLNTSIISVEVTDTSAARSAAIANSVARSLALSVGDLVPELRNGISPIRLETVERADVPTGPSAPSTPLYVVLATLVALGLTLLYVALKDFLRAKVRSPEQASEITLAPVVGVISAQRGLHRDPLVIPHAPNSPRAEQYRQIRTNLRFLQMDQGRKVFVFTSSIPGEAKSTTAANLAATMAAAGTSVCLVEADLRRPSLGPLLDLEGGVGFTTVLTGEADLDDVLQPWGDDGLQVLLAGETPPNPSELLGTRRAEQLLLSIRDRFDVTIIDCPPLMPATDATILARIFGGVVMVVSESKVEVRQLRRAIDKMALIDAPILGTVVTLSKASPAGKGYYHAYRAADAPVDRPAQSWAVREEPSVHEADPPPPERISFGGSRRR